MTGSTGPQGRQGIQGITGIQGATGVQGWQGFQGVTGGGFQGIQGPTGVTGSITITIQSTGMTGVQGFQGWQGSIGNTGSGLQGNAGPTGIQGFQGIQGVQGWTGATGVQGFQGRQGFQGFQGLQGVQGWTGATGVQGFQGLQGVQGWTGATGVQGFQGSGATGVQGRQGPTGPAGGPQGFQGVTGASGSVIVTITTFGATGSQGFQGIAGIQGFQGIGGPTGSGGFSIINPGDNRILTSTGNTNSAYAEPNFTYDGNTLTIGAATGATGTVINVLGSSGQLFSVYDNLLGIIYQIGNISGVPIFQVNSNGSIYLNSAIQNGVTSSIAILSTDKTTGSACYYDYRVLNSITGALRSGTIMAVWNSSSVEYTETSTADLVASTTGISFTVSVVSSNVVLSSTITTGTWDIKVGARVI